MHFDIDNLFLIFIEIYTYTQTLVVKHTYENDGGPESPGAIKLDTQKIYIYKSLNIYIYMYIYPVDHIFYGHKIVANFTRPAPSAKQKIEIRQYFWQRCAVGICDACIIQRYLSECCCY